jgi:hypothetical protein
MAGMTRAVRGGQTEQETASPRATVLALTERMARVEGELVDELRVQLSRERGRRREAEAELRRPWWRRWLGRQEVPGSRGRRRTGGRGEGPGPGRRLAEPAGGGAGRSEGERSRQRIGSGRAAPER